MLSIIQNSETLLDNKFASESNLHQQIQKTDDSINPETSLDRLASPSLEIFSDSHILRSNDSQQTQTTNVPQTISIERQALDNPQINNSLELPSQESLTNLSVVNDLTSDLPANISKNLSVQRSNDLPIVPSLDSDRPQQIQRTSDFTNTETTRDTPVIQSHETFSNNATSGSDDFQPIQRVSDLIIPETTRDTSIIQSPETLTYNTASESDRPQQIQRTSDFAISENTKNTSEIQNPQTFSDNAALGNNLASSNPVNFSDNSVSDRRR